MEFGGRLEPSLSLSKVISGISDVTLIVGDLAFSLLARRLVDDIDNISASPCACGHMTCFKDKGILVPVPEHEW